MIFEQTIRHREPPSQSIFSNNYLKSDKFKDRPVRASLKPLNFYSGSLNGLFARAKSEAGPFPSRALVTFRFVKLDTTSQAMHS